MFAAKNDCSLQNLLPKLLLEHLCEKYYLSYKQLCLLIGRFKVAKCVRPSTCHNFLDRQEGDTSDALIEALVTVYFDNLPTILISSSFMGK